MSSSAVLTSVRRLRSLLAARQGCEQSDEQLLAVFADRRDEIAFATLVRRHGPMVLSVCRRVLGHVQDAEDAYQATFLVLARRAAEHRGPFKRRFERVAKPADPSIQVQYSAIRDLGAIKAKPIPENAGG